MTEAEIRADIKARLSTLVRDVENGVIVEEMGICDGKARADLAVISSLLIGIEIKGPDDNLDRLPAQIDQYSKCFDKVLLVVHALHANDAAKLIPRWWGLVVGSDKNGSNSYQMRRKPSVNREVDVETVLGLLWRAEVETLFSRFIGGTASVRASKKKIRTELLASAPHAALKSAGIELLRQRQEWRSQPV
jgi:hypothetical protein